MNLIVTNLTKLRRDHPTQFDSCESEQYHRMNVISLWRKHFENKTSDNNKVGRAMRYVITMWEHQRRTYYTNDPNFWIDLYTESLKSISK